MARPLRLLLALLVLVTLAPAASAQDEPSAALKSSTPAERAKFQTAFMKQKLSLTDEQLPKVEQINLETAQKMDPVIKGDQRPLMKMRAMRAIELEKETALQGVLTPAQFQQFLAARDELERKLEQHLLEKKAGAGSS